MINETKKGNNDYCSHDFVRQDKKTIQILKRVCTRCGKEDLVSEDPAIDLATAKKIMGIN